MRLIYFFAFLTIFTGTKSSALEEAGQLILNSTLLDYEQTVSYLDDKGENSGSKFSNCCFHKNPESQSKPIRFDAKASWFVLATVDHRALVTANLEKTCKTTFWNKDRACTDEEIADRLKELRSSYRGIPGWYGKYQNRIVATADERPIPDTRKFIGQSIFHLERGSTSDMILIGPLPEKPTEVVFRMNASSREFQIIGSGKE